MLWKPKGRGIEAFGHGTISFIVSINVEKLRYKHIRRKGLVAVGGVDSCANATHERIFGAVVKNSACPCRGKTYFYLCRVISAY